MSKGVYVLPQAPEPLCETDRIGKDREGPQLDGVSGLRHTGHRSCKRGRGNRWDSGTATPSRQQDPDRGQAGPRAHSGHRDTEALPSHLTAGVPPLEHTRFPRRDSKVAPCVSGRWEWIPRGSQGVRHPIRDPDGTGRPFIWWRRDREGGCTSSSSYTEPYDECPAHRRPGPCYSSWTPAHTGSPPSLRRPECS